MAVHTPPAKDNIEQPHLHLMFSERAIDERTCELSEEQFLSATERRKTPSGTPAKSPWRCARTESSGIRPLVKPKRTPAYPALKPMIGGTLQIRSIRAHWDDILRLATSLKRGTVTASLMLRKLGSYPVRTGLP